MTENIEKYNRDLVARVTGELQYLDDMAAGDCLHAALVALPVGHACVVDIEKAQALNMPGVTHVFTARDLPHPLSRFGPMVQDQPVLANRETTFAGQPVAVVLAESPRQARQGAAAVKVNYTALAAVTTIAEALDSGAPLVQDSVTRAADQWRDTNIMGEWNFGWGDIDRGKSQSAVTLANTYTTPFIHHYALEPYGVYAYPEDGGISLHAAIQHPFALRRIIAGMLDLPIAKVRVMATEMGGGFGGRGYPKVEPLAALLVHMTKRSVKISLTADEGFHFAQREGSHVRIRTGFRKDGQITFQEVKADFLVGAYADISPRVVQKAGFLGAGPYRASHVDITARGIFSHTAPTTAFRGFGATHLCFAIESQMDTAARRLKIDPIAIRLKNLPKKGETLIPGDNPVDGDWKSALLKAAEAIAWKEPVDKGRGKGIAIGIKSSVPGTASSAEVRMHADGSVTVYVGTTEMGQGARIAMSRLVGKSLQLPTDRVQVVNGDTGRVPFDTITASSRSTVMMGQAVMAACDNIREKLCAFAAKTRSGDVNHVEISDGCIHAGDERLTYAQVIQAVFGPGMGEIVGQGSYQGEKDGQHPLGGPAAFWELIVTAVELSVDTETGMVDLLKLINVSDVGKVINPIRAVGQDEGGAIMAIGAALMEKIVMDSSGVVLNAGSLDYKVPTIADIPGQMKTMFQENKDGPGPYGSKGIGESGILAALPAIGSAIYNATGIKVRDIPITPEALWRLKTKGEEEKI